MGKELKQNGVAFFDGLSITKAGIVQVKFKFKYDELLTSINLLKFLNNDITIHAKAGIQKPMNLGLFTIGSVTHDRDGNAVIPFKSLVDNVNIENICKLVNETDPIRLKFLAVLELEDKGGEE